MKRWDEPRKGYVALALLAFIFTALVVGAPVWEIDLFETLPLTLMMVGVSALYVAFAPMLLLQSVKPVLWVFPPISLIGGLAIWRIVQAIPPEDLNRIYPGLMTGLIIVLGWFVTFALSYYREEARTDRIRRDTLVAIKNEIFALVDKLDNVAIRKSADEVQKRIRSGIEQPDGTQVEYYPFATMESEPIVFEALAASVPGLSETTVAAVVRFYAEYTDLRRMIEDSRTDDIKSLPRNRRAGFHEQLTKRRIGALTMGLKALLEINIELGIKDPENIGRSGENPGITP